MIIQSRGGSGWFFDGMKCINRDRAIIYFISGKRMNEPRGWFQGEAILVSRTEEEQLILMNNNEAKTR